MNTRTLIFLLLTISACDRSKADTAARADANIAATGSPSADTTPTPDSIAGDIAPWLSLMAAGIDTTMTLETWRTAHPADVVSNTSPPGMSDDTFCRSAAERVGSGTRIWLRSAVFVLPQAPPGEALPDTADVPWRVCRLRALWLEFPAPDPTAAIGATEDVRQQFSRTLGNERAGVSMSGPGTGTWSSGSSWIAGRRVVVVALKPAEHHEDETTGETISAQETAIVVSYLIGRDIDVGVSEHVGRMEYPKVDPEDVVELARADSAITRSGLPGLAQLRRIFAHRLDSMHFDPRSEAPPHIPALDTVLDRALAALRDTTSLTTAQRSAAFLAADIAIRFQAPGFDNTPATQCAACVSRASALVSCSPITRTRSCTGARGWHAPTKPTRQARPASPRSPSCCGRAGTAPARWSW